MELTDKGIRKHAYQHVKKCILPNFNNVVKSKTVVAQKTTTSQTQITIKQQCRWIFTYQNTLDKLLQRNKRVFANSPKAFTEFMYYFIAGGNERCYMACPGRNFKVIGCSTKGKHEKRKNIHDQA